jgi:DNA-binding transcriptional regulator YiaG
MSDDAPQSPRPPANAAADPFASHARSATREDAAKLGIGRAIRARRRQVEMTQQELAAHCGVSYQQIQKYEAGEASLQASRLWMIATALGVSAAALFENLRDWRADGHGRAGAGA